jgi:hypothetical protein
MSAFSPTQGGGDSEERLKRELKNLRRVKAPSSFESELQQRLRGEVQGPARWLAKPIPAYALSAIAVAALGVIGFYFLFRPAATLDNQSTGIQGSGAESTRSLKHDIEPLHQQPAQSEQIIAPAEPARKGPAPSGTEAIIESKVGDRQPDTSNSMKQGPAQPEIEFRYPQEASSQSEQGRVIPPPSVGVRKPAGVMAVGDSLNGKQVTTTDSLKVRTDSLKKVRQKPVR